MIKKDSRIDYLSCILFSFLGPLIRIFPIGFSLFLGRRLGELFCYLDFKHRAIVYSNIKTALGDKLLPSHLNKITKSFYRNFGQNFIEIFFIPIIDKEYLNKYIKIEGFENIEEELKKGKGVILVGMHEGSWELSNIIAANIGFPFILFVRNQRHPRLNKLLNSYRIKKGCRIIQRQGLYAFSKDGGDFYGIRKLIEALKKNETVGLTIDQGGKSGTQVKFFGKGASMPDGAVRIALKCDAAIVPVFYRRLKGPYHIVNVCAPFQIKRTGNLKEDIRDNLQRLVRIFENYISAYPQEYLWTYKIWKYSRERDILILSDGKTGHLRQSEAVAQTISSYLKDKDIAVLVKTIEISFKSEFSKYAMIMSSCFAGKYSCQGCMWCFSWFLKADSFKSLLSVRPDIVVSCGSSLASINYVLSRNNSAKSIVIQRPSVLSMNRFDLVVMPRHDKPPMRKNIVLTGGALNVIDETYLKGRSEKLMSFLRPSSLAHRFYIGFLIGGDTKDFRLSRDLMKGIINQIKNFAEKENVGILVTTSRRSSITVENLVSQELEVYSHCRLLVIANKNNLPFTVGGILGLAEVIVVSPESISMVSEAASCGRYTIVFKSNVSRRHQDFLNYLAERKYIYITEPQDLCSVMYKIVTERPKIYTLDDRTIVRNALEKII